MPIDSETHGYLRFQPIEQYIRVDPEAIHEATLASFGIGRAPLPPSLTDWPRITQSLRRDNTRFVLTAKTPSTRISLQFDTQTEGVGSYEIHAPHERHHEAGTVVQ